MKNIDILLDYKSLFTEDKTFNLDLLKFERYFTFDNRDFDKSKKKIIIEKMEKFLLDLTRNRGDMERCSLKFQETVKKIQLNDMEIHRVLQNSNLNWQSYPALRNPFLHPTTNSSPSVAATATAAAAAAAAAVAATTVATATTTPLAGNYDNNNLQIIQGPEGTLSTIVNERENIKGIVSS